MIEAERRVQDSLKEMDGLFEGFYAWLAGQHDPRTGGFFYARSSIGAPELEPDIESAAQALSILERSSLIERLPRAMLDGLAAFFRGKQDPESGFFYDRDPNMRKDEVMVARAMGYATHALRRLGRAPKYPLPEAEAAPGYMDSIESYLEWLERTDLRNAWRGCDLMMSANHFIERKPKGERESFIEAARRRFADIQDPATGLWGGGNLYTRISGTFKMNMFYRSFGLPMPRAKTIYRSLLLCLRTEEALDMCWIRNPIDLLGSFRGRLALPREEWAEILGITLGNMRLLLRADGGFSREARSSPVAPNVAQVKEGEFYPNMPIPVPLGRGLAEGDMNAGTQAMLIREVSYELCGLRHEPLTRLSADFEKAIGVLYA